jgi:hypothetical protein
MAGTQRASLLVLGYDLLRRAGIRELGLRIGAAEGDVDHLDHILDRRETIVVDICPFPGTRWIEHRCRTTEGHVHCQHNVLQIRCGVAQRIAMAHTNRLLIWVWNRRAVVARVAYTVAVRIQLAEVRNRRAVISVAANAVTVHVIQWIVRAGVTGIAYAIAICVQLVGVRNRQAVVARIAYAVAIRVGLISVRSRRAVVYRTRVGRITGVAIPVPIGVGARITSVTYMIAVRILLPRIRDGRAVVDGIGHSIVVTVWVPRSDVIHRDPAGVYVVKEVGHLAPQAKTHFVGGQWPSGTPFAAA